MQRKERRKVGGGAGRIQEEAGGVQDVPLIGEIEDIELFAFHAFAKSVLPDLAPGWVEHGADSFAMRVCRSSE